MAKESTFEDPWTPLKELAATVEAAVLRSQPGILNDLESVLKKHKPTFIGLLKNAPRSSADAALVKTGPERRLTDHKMRTLAE